jgi:hypothetical protein
MDKETVQKFADWQKDMQKRYAKFFRETEIEIGVIGDRFLTEILRRAWNSSDAREREWCCFRLREVYSSMVRRHDMTPEQREKEDLDVTVTGPRYLAPPISAFEAAVFHFQHSKRARRCRNAECFAPYFFASKRGQEFCSIACARPVRLESQRRWWHENKGRAKKRKKRRKKR